MIIEIMLNRFTTSLTHYGYFFYMILHIVSVEITHDCLEINRALNWFVEGK